MTVAKKVASIRVVKPGSGPDVDSDFNTEIRDEVLAYCEEVQGHGSLSNIITFSTMAAKGAFKAMCTIYNVPFAQANKIAALIPPPIDGVDCTINDIFNVDSDRYAEGVDFRTATSGEEWKHIIAGAMAIEGRNRSTGVHPCFAEGTLVRTSEGYRAIEAVAEGDLVLTHSNSHQSVVEVMRGESDDYYLLRAANSIPTEVTGSHPFYVRSICYKPSSKTGDSTRYLSEPSWMPLEELVPGEHVIGVPVNSKSELPEGYPTLPLESADFWWTIGRFVGDGWCEDFISRRNRKRRDGTPYVYERREKRAIISVGYNDPTKAELLEKVGAHYAYRTVDTRTVQKLHLKHNEELFNFLKSFGRGAAHKEIPEFVLNLPTDLLREFLRGYLSADGWVNSKTGTHTFSTVSKKLMLGMVAVVNKVYGVHCNTSHEPREKMVIEGREVDCRDRYLARFSEEGKLKNHSFYEDGYIWASISSIEKLEGTRATYNLSVVDDNSYVANNLIAHNCGVVMSSKPLSEVIPLQVRQSDNRVISQWSYPELENLGLIKFDFLGLDTVDLLQHTVEYVKKNGKTPPNLVSIIHGEMDDQKTYEMLGRGDTIGIFQLASPGVQDLLRKMKPTAIDDIVATTALYRPGPMGMQSHIKYAERKNGRELVEYPVHPEFKNSPLEKILEKTYSLVVYQEQVTQIANQIGGMTLQEGDDLRKAMGKKNKVIMDKMKPVFIEGGKARGYSEQALQVLWATMATFAEYGFNKSHSVAYAMNAYQAAFLKANYPQEFMAALIAQNVNDKDKILAFLQEARKMGLKVGSADINASDVRVSPDFTNASKFDIVYGLSGINAVSVEAAKAIIAEREKHGKYKSVQDLINRCSPLGVTNRKIYENLALAGAFDSFRVSRRSVVENLPAMLGESKVKQAKGASLFDMLGGTEVADNTVDLNGPEYPHVLKLKKEADVIGLYLTAHPLSNAGNLGGLRTSNIAKLLKSREQVSAKIVASLTDVTVKRMRRGGKSVQVTFDDGTGYLTAFLNRDIIKGIDKQVAQERVRKLYEGGATEVAQELRDMAIAHEFTARPELEKGRVYSLSLVFRPGFDDNPYAARVSDINELELADDGSLPVRVRLPKPATREKKAEQVAFLKGLAQKHPGTSPIFATYVPHDLTQLLGGDDDSVYLDALDALDAGAPVLTRGSAPVDAREMSLSGERLERKGKAKKTAEAVESYREWPPPKQDRGPARAITLQSYRGSAPLIASAIEKLDYRPTKFRVEKNAEVSRAIEDYLGIENYDYGVFNSDILTDD